MTTSSARTVKPLADASDEDIVAHVLRGGTDAFALLMRRHNQRLYRIARGITGIDASAEDVLQQAYVSAYRHLGQFQGRAQFGTWLRRIVVREAMRSRRQAERRRAVHEEAKAHVIEFPAPPEQRLSARQWALLVGAAIDELPNAYRVVLIMRKLEQMSTEETAEVLSLSPENVRIRLHRARKLLADRLYDRVGAAADEVYEFGGPRCDRIVARVLDDLGL
jgi:RNA polymerase sigma-70 factor (ECF subfamily)